MSSTTRGRVFARRKRALAQQQKAAPLVRFAPRDEDEAIARMDVYAMDPELFIEECLEVRHIDGGAVVPFKLTIGQRIVVRKVKWRLRCGLPVRLCILKSRRQKISSLCQALAYWYTSTRAYVEALICADKNDLTEEIFERGVKTFYRSDRRRDWGLRPETEASSKRELKFGNPDARTRDAHPGLQSVLVVTSAESKEPGRGGTKHFVHASEASYWPEEPPPWQAIGIALSNAPGTIALVEATANGAGGFFHDTCVGAIQGTNEFDFVFLAWWIDPDNRQELTPQERAEWKWGHAHEDAAEEEKYALRYKLSLEQMKWRRAIIASPKCYRAGRPRIEVFQQEYPARWEESFLTSSKNFFIPGKVGAWKEHPQKGERDPLFTARVVNEGPPLDDRGPGRLTPVKPVLEPDEDGELAVWAHYDPSEEYLVVCDPAEGIAGRDETVIGVLARNAFDVVAIFRSTALSTREAAHVVALLGWFFDRALVVVEANNHGGAVLQELTRILYPKLWYHIDVTKPGSMPGEKPGWVQSHAARMYALRLLEAETRQPLLGVHDPDFFDQALTFVWPKARADGGSQENAKPAAMAGKNDDIILMLAMMLAVHINAAITKRKKQPDPPADPNEPLRPEPMNLTMKQAADKKTRRIRGRSLWGRGSRR